MTGIAVETIDWSEKGLVLLLLPLYMKVENIPSANIYANG